MHSQFIFTIRSQKIFLTKFYKAFIMRLVLIKSHDLRLRQADIAHLVERNLAKVEVASSSLVVRSRICGSSSVVEHNLAKVGVASSSLVFRSNFFDNKLVAVGKDYMYTVRPVHIAQIMRLSECSWM